MDDEVKYFVRSYKDQPVKRFVEVDKSFKWKAPLTAMFMAILIFFSGIFLFELFLSFL